MPNPDRNHPNVEIPDTDTETEALRDCITIMSNLDRQAASRIIGYLYDRYTDDPDTGRDLGRQIGEKIKINLGEGL